MNSLKGAAKRIELLGQRRPAEIGETLHTELVIETPRDTGETAAAWQLNETPDRVQVRNDKPWIRRLNYRHKKKRLFVETAIDTAMAKERGDVLGE